MAGEIQAVGPSGKLFNYAQIVNSLGQFARIDTHVFEAYVTANIANYAVALAELGIASGVYKGDFPSWIPLTSAYTILSHQGATGTQAESDPIITVQSIGDITANINQIGNNAQAAVNLGRIYGVLETGTAQGGGPSTIVLRAGASSIDNFYYRQAIVIVAGTGVGQTNRCDSYVGATRTMVVTTPWIVQPDNTSVYDILGRIG